MRFPEHQSMPNDPMANGFEPQYAAEQYNAVPQQPIHYVTEYRAARAPRHLSGLALKATALVTGVAVLAGGADYLYHEIPHWLKGIPHSQQYDVATTHGSAAVQDIKAISLDCDVEMTAKVSDNIRSKLEHIPGTGYGAGLRGGVDAQGNVIPQSTVDELACFTDPNQSVKRNPDGSQVVSIDRGSLRFFSQYEAGKHSVVQSLPVLSKAGQVIGDALDIFSDKKAPSFTTLIQKSQAILTTATEDWGINIVETKCDPEEEPAFENTIRQVYEQQAKAQGISSLEVDFYGTPKYPAGYEFPKLDGGSQQITDSSSDKTMSSCTPLAATQPGASATPTPGETNPYQQAEGQPTPIASPANGVADVPKQDIHVGTTSFANAPQPSSTAQPIGAIGG